MADNGLADALALFNISPRMHARWWDLAAEGVAGSDKGRADFDHFATEIIEFLKFKRLPVPPSCSLEVVLRSLGQPTPQHPGGLTTEPTTLGIQGGINLSDEESALVFRNLTGTHLSIDYPLTRANLAPGEGYWLPRCPILMDGDTRGRTEVDVQLVIRAIA